MPEVGRLTHKCTESRQQQTDSISWPRNFKQPNIHIKRYFKIEKKRTVCFLKKGKKDIGEQDQYYVVIFKHRDKRRPSKKYQRLQIEK